MPFTKPNLNPKSVQREAIDYSSVEVQTESVPFTRPLKSSNKQNAETQVESTNIEEYIILKKREMYINKKKQL